ncbi:MAG: HpaII family restriction endonuclease [Patescibacteria group bacterium]|nr:HpaII family restriction endonuclease [Patescibacteria group bacterium]
MIKGNKGEWSEFYTFIKLLAEKQLNGADENLQKIQDIFYPVLKIIREEAAGRMDYEFVEDNKVKIIQAGTEVALVDSSDLKTKVVEVFQAIRDGAESTFSIPVADSLMTRFHATRLNAGNARKEDITLKIHDHVTGTEPEVGFSIKSMLGAASTLLNPSAATNFVYKIEGLSEEQIAKINAIDTRSKVRDRLSAIVAAGGSFSYYGISSDTFTRNLRRVDTVLPEIVAQLLLAFYLGKGSGLPELIANLGNGETNILSFDLDRSDYEFKVKSLLHNVALGMVPDTAWDGLLRAHGGYIIVREDGEMVCYHVYNADAFRAYLFKNTRFDTPSTTRYGFGKVYQENDSLFIKLTLQIRFIK